MDRFISKIYEYVEFFLKKITSSVDEGRITKYNFIFLLWGFLTLLEFLYYFLDMKYRPIGEMYAYIAPDNKTISILILSSFLAMSFYSTLLFLYFLIKVYKNIRNNLF
jgi:hypothetical protein